MRRKYKTPHFYHLWFGNVSHSDWVNRCLGIPSSGFEFWRNISQCCSESPGSSSEGSRNVSSSVRGVEKFSRGRSSFRCSTFRRFRHNSSNGKKEIRLITRIRSGYWCIVFLRLRKTVVVEGSMMGSLYPSLLSDFRVDSMSQTRLRVKWNGLWAVIPTVKILYRFTQLHQIVSWLSDLETHF